MQARQRKSALAHSAPVFAALGDKTRLRLVARRCSEGPVSITGLASGSDISRQGITKHLHVLAEAGLVRAVRQGRETIYQLDPKQLQQASQSLEIISRHWDQALTRLKSFMENR